MSLRWLLAVTLTLFALVHALPPDKRDTNPELQPPQEDAPIFLGLISRLKSKTAKFRPPWKYDYDPSAGEGSIIWLIDSGFDTNTPEYKSWSPEPRWIIVKKYLPDDTLNKDDPDGHGTCSGSLISSPKYGVSKKASLVIVKAPIVSAPEITRHHVSHLKATLWAVVDDLKSVLRYRPDLKGKLFVNFSAGMSTEEAENVSKRDMSSIKKAFEEIDSMAMIYTTTGNRNPKQRRRDKREGTHSPFSSETMYLERWRDDLPHTTFVASADINGRRSAVSIPPSPGTRHLWAVAQDIKCAPLSGQKSSDHTSGTSLAAPQAVGLAAYAVGLPHKPFSLPDPQENFDGYVAELQDVLESSSWKLPPSMWMNKNQPEVPVISNRFCEGVDGESSGKCGC
ncbi:hypothetical protein NUU61_006149 [Penicillium alfredii]|uniref:Peptidase S8/S53 domain-containing protein n=1 Tax=Penicillium alfredii TaxID=1506179 RepID=A0A9W9F0A2_9EURO|nr:uncharacterized protein NUU61_006149 [Penicillium alfredii]KAJ5091279.1 hypothetical protein NUU61_006149 [Penicillium alfredii]